MSRWTHISGSIELSSEPFEYKKINVPKPSYPRTKENDEAWSKYWDEVKKKAYYPYPEKQFVLGTPTFQDTFDHKPYTRIQVYEYSLPRAQKYIDKAFELLPYGEIGWKPAIKQDKYYCRTSSSCGEYDCQKKAFQKGVLDLYKDEFSYMSFKDLEKLLKLDLTWIDHVGNIIIGIREDIRYCSGLEMMEGLEKFFVYLRKNGIDLESGYLEWYDEWNPAYIYAWRCSFIDDDCEYKYMILDAKTNQVLYTRKHSYKKLDDGEDDFFNIERAIIEEGDLNLAKEEAEEE